MKNYNKPYQLLLIVLLLCVMTVMIVGRDVTIGDTGAYQTYFKLFVEVDGYIETRFEPLFSLLTYFSFLISDDVRVFFFVVFLFTLIPTLYFINEIYNYLELDSVVSRSTHIIFILGWVFCSSWYFVATTNGLRQGISLMFLYWSFICFLSGNTKKYFFLSLVSVLFHYSSVLFVFSPLISKRFSANTIILLLPLTLVIYFINGFEFLVQVLSSVSGIPLYSSINKFSTDALWTGFDPLLVSYTLGLLVVTYGMSYFIPKLRREKFLNLVSLLSVLILTYFIFGFGGYSNRLAYVAWLFSFFVIPYYVFYYSINFYIKCLLILSIFSVSPLVFYMRMV